jgi:hypothetical protein
MDWYPSKPQIGTNNKLDYLKVKKPILQARLPQNDQI